MATDADRSAGSSSSRPPSPAPAPARGEWAAFGFMEVLALLSFNDARPRGYFGERVYRGRRAHGRRLLGWAALRTRRVAPSPGLHPGRMREGNDRRAAQRRGDAGDMEPRRVGGALDRATERQESSACPESSASPVSRRSIRCFAQRRDVESRPCDNRGGGGSRAS
jgi:hypothetical protein